VNQNQGLKDPYIFWLGVVLTLVGLGFIYDAGYWQAIDSSRGYFPQEFSTQVLVTGVAGIFFFVFQKISLKGWRTLADKGFALALFLVIATEFVGITTKGARRWLGYGGFRVQPAEFLKLAVVLYLALVLADRKPWEIPKLKRRNVHSWLKNIGIPIVRRAFPAILVAIGFLMVEKEPDMGTAAVIAVTMFAMFIPARVSGRSLLIALAFVGIFAVVGSAKEGYRSGRISSHLHRWQADNAEGTSYQSIMSELSQATGGITGVGIGNGRAKSLLPESTTDFIMATVGEETGLIGSLFVMSLLGALVLRILWQAHRATDGFSALVLYGLGAWIGIQSCVNIMMANAFLPPIGIPLPFISAGGSSLLVLWIALAVCQSLIAPPELTPISNVAPEEERNKNSINRWRDGRPHISGA
jgi:cell division protein FtsW